MKYICQVCNELCDEAFAVDSDGYYCSRECYNENYTEDEPEDAIKVQLDKQEPKKKWWKRDEEK